MRLLGNILWHIPFLGFINAALTFLLGLLFLVTVIGSPIGLGLIQFSKFLLAPFGNAMVSNNKLVTDTNPVWRTYSTIIMIIYLPFGLIIAVLAIVQMIGMFLSIVGIPVALVIAKSLGTYLNPVSKVCVPSSVVDEMERRSAAEYLDNRPK